MNRVLLVEDEKNIRESVETALSDRYEVSAFESAEKALTAMADNGFDILITDIKLPGMTGIELLSKFKTLSPDSPVIVMTAFSSINSAIEAMKAGADEYVPKPFSLEELEIKTENLLKIKKIKEDKNLYVSQQDSAFGEIAGTSPEINSIKTSISKIAANDVTVLITGETGTGKELIAYTIHKLSGRKGPFVPVHCAAYAKGVIESELFGHEKGAFTGADKLRRGRIETAQDGTLFLDELGDIPLDIQVKLLRVLENKTYERVGGSKSLSTNARVLCATNRNLEELIKKGEFREDLFYRVNVFPVNIPPLRNRKEDIQALAETFASKHGRFKFTPAGKNALLSYGWPGNVRELQNIIERAVILSAGSELNITDALGKTSAEAESSGNGGLENMVEAFEKKIIEASLKNNNYNQTKTSKELQISRTTLQYKIQKYSITEKTGD
ncbi:MAG: sigma-54-dependent Fis family transcriptional regulator [Candidatus Goldbacteria bacterium]|nr:sigma-54-dependent Fis family transcriptional regulator [Candidatus Goldiibacteriota bacterium]